MKPYPKTWVYQVLTIATRNIVQLYRDFGDEEMEVSEILCPDNPWSGSQLNFKILLTFKRLNTIY